MNIQTTYKHDPQPSMVKIKRTKDGNNKNYGILPLKSNYSIPC